MTLPHPKHFTNREEALNAYDDLWQPDTTQRILNYQGLSGNGKSTLLWYIANHYDTTERPRLLLDLDSDTLRSQDHALLDRIATGFANHLPPGALRNYNQLVAKLDDEAAAIRRSTIDTQIDLTATQGGQITQSPIDIAAEINKRLAVLRRPVWTQLTATLVSALMPLAHRESVLLLDTYEKVRQSSDEDFRSWLEEDLLEAITATLPAWRILLAGREDLPYRADRHRKNTLRHWTEAESRHFLASYDLTDNTLQTAIFDHCQGHPLLTDYARDVWEQGNVIDRPLTPDDLLHDINREAAAHWLQKLLLQRLSEPLRSGLEAAALLRYLSSDVLNALLPDDRHLSRDDYGHLLDFSFIQKVPGEAPRVHDLIRQTEDAWYRDQATEFYRECHKKALQYYTQLADTTTGDDKIPDQMFHYLALDQAEAMKVWRQAIDQRRLRYDLVGQTNLLIVPRLPERWPWLAPGEQADWFFHNGLLATRLISK